MVLTLGAVILSNQDKYYFNAIFLKKNQNESKKKDYDEKNQHFNHTSTWGKNKS